MLKNRNFLTGLGIGIIVGALLLQLMLIGEQSQRELGAGLNGADEKLYSQAELDAAIEAERMDAQSRQSAETATESDAKKTEAPSNTPAATETPKPSATSGNTEKTKQETPVERKVRIVGGMNLTSTAKLLFEEGIITDQSEFIAKMKRSKKQVRAGHFLFKGQPALDEVMKVITSQPLTKEEVEALKKRGIE
ncbi:hypothetical protein [Paenibacillus sp. NEAU-GSW1]|uniref:hypothetical protein n=1 Tax=Paenibacillus sp. NEAU-GSW1 TaxID=2682486 RepID=UPI0012E164D8|nr:hypothetical protein [Paenibacillus sp. NEAU-GSW1]MUT66383.1 hypothetical protein [Paenibacillus sp. NEAU-GSW1]